MDPTIGVPLVALFSLAFFISRVSRSILYAGDRASLFSEAVEAKLPALAVKSGHGRMAEIQALLLRSRSGEKALGLVFSTTDVQPHQFESMELNFSAVSQWILGVRAALDEAGPESWDGMAGTEAGADATLPEFSYFGAPVQRRLCGVSASQGGIFGGRRFLRLFLLQGRAPTERLFGLDFSQTGIFQPAGLSPMVLSGEVLREHLRQIESLSFS